MRQSVIRQFVFVLSIAVLPDLERDTYKEFSVEESGQNWYNKDEMVGEIR